MINWHKNPYRTSTTEDLRQHQGGVNQAATSWGAAVGAGIVAAFLCAWAVLY